MAVGRWNIGAANEIVILVCLFIAAFALLSRRRLCYLFVIAGLLQAAIIFGQIAGIVRSWHPIFPVTGFAGNPGLAGGFQAVSLVCALSLLKERRTLCASVACAVIFVSLCLADSRAGWVAACAGAVFVWRDKIRSLLSRRAYLILPCVIATAAAAVGLYFYRSGSADARLLIWRVSLDMFMDKPLTGFGAGNFPLNYMLHQADYFACHPESRFSAVADNVTCPFNEYIKIAVEFGTVGLAVSAFALLVFWRCLRDREGFAPMLAILVFGAFSYPSESIVLAPVLPLAAGAALHGNVSRMPVWPRLAAALAAAVVTGFVCVGVLTVRPVDSPGCIPSCEKWCDLGEESERGGCIAQAEYYYRTASYMVPTRIRPNYMLWRMYVRNGRGTEAREVAWKILSMPLKLENTFTLRAKDEVRAWSRSGLALEE